ncbi:MAG: hypothetical protein Kow0069_38050 [Promethearchaeota archaeon]
MLGAITGSYLGTTRVQSSVHFTVAYSSEKLAWMGEIKPLFEEWWAEEHPEMSIRVEFQRYGSVDSFVSILTGENHPVVWSPASSIWIPIFKTRWQAQGGVHANEVVVANVSRVIFSPLVIATWQSFAEENEITGFSSLHQLISTTPGLVKLAHTDPRSSNSGFMAVIMAVSAYTGKEPADLTLEDLVDPGLQAWMREFESAAVQWGTSTGFLADLMVQLGPAAVNVAIIYENLVAEVSNDYPGEKVVAIYPEEGTLYSDHPFCVLNASWVTKDQQFVGNEFLRFLQRPDIVSRATTVGFRPINASIPLDPDAFDFEKTGVSAAFQSPELEVPQSGEVIERIPDLWLITRPTA